MKKIKFSKDPKVHVLSIEEFLQESNYLYYAKIGKWKNNTRPRRGVYYKITPQFLIMICYSNSSDSLSNSDFLIKPNKDLPAKLDEISVAFRDGKTEYELFDIRLCELLENKKCAGEDTASIDKQILKLEAGRRLLNKTEYRPSALTQCKKFEDFISYTDYKTSSNLLIGKYVVFDVETNGLRKSNDDLLSISIYDPSTGMCYNRYLPLDLQPLVLTGWCHGITDEELEGLPHITQEELNRIIDVFDLKNKTLLSYSGGEGKFDSSFVINYCKRHNLVGFENLHFENIKDSVPYPGYGFADQMSKDNLCKLFKIDGVDEMHTSLNDCILEWKLFEKIKNQPLFFIGQDMFKYNEKYIMPISYLLNHPELTDNTNLTLPFIEGKATCIFDYTLPKEATEKVKKFQTNITGISLEHAIDTALNAEYQDNSAFLCANKKKLEYIGSLKSSLEKIPLYLQDDGTLKTSDPKHASYISEVNEVSKIIIESISPVINYIRKEIFKSNIIYNQEMCISPDGKILALCDLSSNSAVLEIKTLGILQNGENIIKTSLAQQLYYESRGRDVFVLDVKFDKCVNDYGLFDTDSVSVLIYKIELTKTEPKPIVKTKTLKRLEIVVLKTIEQNPSISNAEIARRLGQNPMYIGRIIMRLKFFGYLEKTDPKKRTSQWKLLRKVDDINTKCSIFNGEITLISDKSENNDK